MRALKKEAYKRDVARSKLARKTLEETKLIPAEERKRLQRQGEIILFVYCVFIWFLFCYNLDALELRYNTHSFLLFYRKIGVIVYDRKR